MQASAISTEGNETRRNTHTEIREELRFLSRLIYLLVVHQLSRPGDDIMCDISPWRYLSVLFQPRLNPPPSRQNSIPTYRDLPPQSHPLPKCSPGRPARGAGMAICVGPVAMQSLADSGCCLSCWHLMAAKNILARLQKSSRDVLTPH